MSLFGRRSREKKVQSQPAIEPLESRAYMSASLVVTVPGPLPVSVISGATVNDKISINIANNGPDAAHGRALLTLFASTDTSLDSNDAQITTHAISLNLGAGKNKTFKINVKAFPQNLDGSYYILGEVSTGPVVASSAGTVSIVPPEIDLSGLVTKVPKSARIGHKMPVTVEVGNDGNVTAKGNLAVAFDISSDPSGSAPVTLATVSKRINLKAGKTQTLHLSVPVPPGSPSGNQYVVATVDPSNVFLDPNLANNSNVNQTAVSVT